MPPDDVTTQFKSPFATPAANRTLVGASVLSADFGHLARDARAAVESGADMLHVDVMDGHFCPNLSMGPAVCGALSQHLPDTDLDVHLMVERPSEYLESFARAGAHHLTVHVEVEEELAGLAHASHELGCTAGVAVNPDTPVERVLEVVEHFDMVLVMSVFPGFSGQSFIGDVLETTRVIREQLGPDAWIQMDGGVAPATAQSCRDAGCNVLVSASAIFGSQDYAAAIAAIRGA